MARNGTGQFTLVTNSWNPAINGVSATAADWQTLITDVANSITQSTSADGQTPITGVWNYGGYRISNAGAGTNAGDVMTYGQSGAAFDSMTVTSSITAGSLTASTVNGSTTTQPPGTNDGTIASTAFVVAQAFSVALPAQAGKDGLEVTTRSGTAFWGFSAGTCLGVLNFFGA
jgi:hypothetical protein